MQYGRRFELPITVYEVDARGSKFKRDDVTVVARILEELWRKMASISSGKPLDAVPGVMSSLEAISQELRHNSMRLGAAIRAEESAQRYTAS